MGGERERPRNEPSFSEEGIDSIADHESNAQVDLDQLLNEIGKSMDSTPSRPDGQTLANKTRKASSSIMEEEPTEELPRMRPEQPPLDFGESEPSYDGKRKEPQTKFTDDNLNGEEPMSRGVLMAGGALLALSLLCGVVGMFVAFSASGKIAALQQSVDALQTKLATTQLSGDPRVGQLQAEQAGLSSRLDELATKIDAIPAGPSKGGEAQLVELRKRIDALEHKTPQPAKVAELHAAAATKSPAAKPAPTGGDWTVILVSFPAAAQAESERTRLQKVGIRAEVLKSQVDGKPWYRVRVPGYATQDAAKAAMPGLESKSGINGAWIAHR